MKWRNHCTKIVLKASESELREILKRKDARYFIDSGQTTQVRSGSLTTVALFPCYEIEEFEKKYKLL